MNILKSIYSFARGKTESRTIVEIDRRVDESYEQLNTAMTEFTRKLSAAEHIHKALR